MVDHSRLPLAIVPEAGSDDFLGVLRMLAHRLSQPLTTLRGSIEVALMGGMNEVECRQVLELSLQESHRMAEILGALRDVLEMEGAGKHIQPLCWTRCVEKLLEEAASVEKEGCPRLMSETKEVWVKASPQHLGTATARLIGGAVRAAHARREVLVSLSVHAETACLSVCEESLPSDADSVAGRFPAPLVQEISVLEGLDQWVVRRAIERQGGWLKIWRVSESCRCYELGLPLAASEIVRP